MKVLAVANQKGGVGKTTTAVTLAEGLARLPHPRSVLLVDLDPQGQCAIALGQESANNVFRWLIDDALLHEVIISSDLRPLHLLPGGKRTATAVMVLMADGELLPVVKRRLERRSANCYDFAILDTAPTLGGLQEAALFASDGVIIPSACDSASLDGVSNLVKTLQAVQGRGGKACIWGILPTFYDNTRESEANLQSLREKFGELVLPPIHRAVVIREAWAVGESIWTYAPDSRAAQEYAALVWEVDRR